MAVCHTQSYLFSATYGALRCKFVSFPRRHRLHIFAAYLTDRKNDRHRHPYRPHYPVPQYHGGKLNFARIRRLYSSENRRHTRHRRNTGQPRHNQRCRMHEPPENNLGCNACSHRALQPNCRIMLSYVLSLDGSLRRSYAGNRHAEG